MAFDVYDWWRALCAVSAVNVCAWFWAAALWRRRGPALPHDAHRLRRLQLLLAAVYVLGCGFRSLLPVYDVPRLCLFDTWLSSVAMGRSVATLAELCFATQWALLLDDAARRTGSTAGRRIAAAIVPLIVLAESFSWYSVLTTSNIGHVVEETLWGLAAALLVVGLVRLWPLCSATLRPWLLAWSLAGLAYVAYMFSVDVPMYWARWLADQHSGRPTLSLAEGWLDVVARRTVSADWRQWRSEVTWMTLYFSVAVWFSIALVHAPLVAPRPLRLR